MTAAFCVAKSDCTISRGLTEDVRVGFVKKDADNEKAPGRVDPRIAFEVNGAPGTTTPEATINRLVPLSFSCQEVKPASAMPKTKFVNMLPKKKKVLAPAVNCLEVTSHFNPKNHKQIYKQSIHIISLKPGPHEDNMNQC